MTRPKRIREAKKRRTTRPICRTQKTIRHDVPTKSHPSMELVLPLFIYLSLAGLIYILMGEEFRPIKWWPTLLTDYRVQTLTTIALAAAVHITIVNSQKDETAITNLIPTIILGISVLATVKEGAASAVLGIPLLTLLAGYLAHSARGGDRKLRERRFFLICSITILAVLIIAFTIEATGNSTTAKELKQGTLKSTSILATLAILYKLTDYTQRRIKTFIRIKYSHLRPSQASCKRRR